jgi:hypothetical protein
MRRLTSLAILFLVGWTAPVDAQVVVDPPTSNTLEVEVWCTVAAPTTIVVTLAIADDFDDALGGVRLERNTLGDCGDPVPIGRVEFDVLMTGVHSVTFEDATAASDAAHRYRAIGLGADGDDLPTWASSFDLVSPIDYATCGDPVLGIGRITSAVLPAVFEPCPDGCWDMLPIALDPADDLIDSPTVVSITGTIDCGLGNVEGCTIVPDALEPSQCGPVGRDGESWGGVKARFRAGG